MPLAIGSYVGRIRIDALLGAGGMGEVYRGWDEKLERAVALKSITSERRLSPALRTRFLREARVLSKLDHPNICRIWDVLELVDGDWLVLELIDGPTLRERMERDLPKQEAIEIALEIARVLAVAHGRGIIHRDLKPENVMQTTGGVVKVLDFGLARAVEAEYASETSVDGEPIDLEKTLIIGDGTTSPDDSKTSIGSLVGTLHYMSPEQARGLPLTPASDVYSLGVMLHEMLRGGEGAYGDPESVAELLQKVRGAELVPHDFRDRELQRLLAHMTSQQPADRPAAGEVVAALERIATRPMRRRRRMIEVASIAAMLALVVIAVLFIRQVTLARHVLGSRIAILPFRNATGDRGLQWVELGLMDHVVRGLAGVRGVDIIDTSTVMKSMKQQRLTSNVELTSNTRRHLLDALGADALIASTVTSHNGHYTIRYSAFDRERREESREVSSELITDAANRMSAQLAQRIDPAARLHAAGTSDTFAAIAYDMGRQLELTRGGKYAEVYYAVATDRDPQYLEPRWRLADNYAKEGRLAEAMPIMDSVLREARQRRQLGLLSAALIDVADWYYGRGDSVKEEQYAREALQAAQQEGNEVRIGKAMNSVAVALSTQNRIDESEKLELAALDIARRHHVRVDIAERTNNLALIAMRRNDRAAAKKYLEEAAQIAEEIGFRDMAAIVIGNLAILYGDAGDFDRAEALTRKDLAMARELGDRKTEVEALTNLGLWAYARNHESEAIDYTEQARQAAAKFGATHVEALLLSNLAQARTRLGDLAAGQRDADAAMDIGRTLRAPAVMPDIYVGKAYPAIRAGRLAEAAHLLDEADAVRKTPRATIFRARLAYAQGKYTEASALIEKAKTMGDTWFPQYESMRLAFAESAKTGKPSTIRFEER